MMRFVCLIVVNVLIVFQLTQPVVMSTFDYFAYGSNLLSERIHMNNPSAVRIGIAKFNGYRLDFNSYGPYWDGSPSTVVPDAESHVWGVVWRMDDGDMASLDGQEQVPQKMYEPFHPVVVTPEGNNVTCRCYKQTDQPAKQSPLPLERRPSKAYLRTVVLGAIESGLPPQYLSLLVEIPDNGRNGPSMPWLGDNNATVETTNTAAT